MLSKGRLELTFTNKMNFKWIYAVIAAMLWGASFPLIKLGLKSTSPLLFAFLRYFLASIFFILIAHEVQLKKDFVLLGLVGVAIPVILQNIALQFTPAYISGFLQSTGPIYVLIFATLFLKEKFTWNKFAGIMIAFLGTYFLISGYEKINLLADFLILLSAFFYSIGSIIAKKLLNNGYKAMNVIVSSTVFATLFLFPSIPFEKIRFSIASMQYAFVLALLPTFLAYILWYNAMEKMEISRLSCFIYLIPFFSLIFSSIFLNEALETIKIFYGIVIIAGIAIAEA